MTTLTSRRKMLALCGTTVGLAGCSGSDADTTTTPTSTDIPTPSHEPTITPTATQSSAARVSLLRTAIIDADNIDEGFDAPAVDQVVIGREIAIFYEAEVPVRNGTFEAVVHVGLSVLGGHHYSMMIYDHEGSADSETARIKGHQRQPTEDFLPEKLQVEVNVAEEMPGPGDHEEFVVPIVAPTEEGNTEN